MTTQTTPPHGGAPNAFVAMNATKTDRIALDELALVGICGEPGKMRAILRLPSGEIRTLSQGDKTEIGRLTEIEATGVVLTKPTGLSAFVPPIAIG
ncbi:MAG: hypothetical protein ACRBCL_11870 [Maritimibacter sp.]